MPATNAYAAKAAIIDRLKVSAEPGSGGLLAVLSAANQEWGNRITVSYALDGEMGSAAIYGGGFTIAQEDAVEETPGVLIGETVNLLLYVRAQSRAKPGVDWLDNVVRQVANTMVKVFAAAPVLGNGVAVIGSRGGAGDYSTNDDEQVSLMSYTLTVASLFGWTQ